MCRLLVNTVGSVDGLMQAPGAPDEHRSVPHHVVAVAHRPPSENPSRTRRPPAPAVGI